MNPTSDVSLSDLFSSDVSLSDLTATAGAASTAYKSLGDLIGGGSTSAPTPAGSVPSAAAKPASSTIPDLLPAGVTVKEAALAVVGVAFLGFLALRGR